MNKRIKDFYNQVGLDFENFQRVTVTKGDMEKFAELIVRHCALTAGLMEHHGRKNIGAQILDNFGIQDDTV
jgi:coenzyme F420-reducing hydrogenase delta subunit